LFNNNFPPINNMMPNPMYQVQPNPMGNILSIGQQGYNGGYYNNTYNNYYNPYLAIKQQEIAQAQLKEQMRQQSDVMKKISRAVNKAAGVDISNETLDKIYNYQEPEQYRPNPDSSEYMQSFVANLYVNGMDHLPQDVQYVHYFNSMYDRTKQMIPDDVSMYEYNNMMSEQYVQMLQDKEKDRQRDISKLYNNNDYHKLLNMNNKSGSYFNSIFNGGNMNNNVSIDDMEVSLPNHISNEYQSRRKQFLDAILSK